MHKPCKQCDKQITKTETTSIRDWNERVKFCSRNCANASRRGKPSPSPKTTFKKGQKPSMKAVDLNRKRFTGERNPKWKGGKVDKKCVICSTSYKVKPYMRYRSKTCSADCRSQYQKTEEARKHMSKIHKLRVKHGLHNTFIDGKSKERDKAIRHSVRYRIWREMVFRRDDYTCQECGIRGGVLNADHIKPFASFPTLRFDIDNGRTLCISCHLKTETWGMHAVNQIELTI